MEVRGGERGGENRLQTLSREQGGQKLVRQPWALREPPFKWLILCRPTLYKPVKQATCPLRIALVYWEPKLEENSESFHLTCLRSCHWDSPRCFFNAVSSTLPTVLVTLFCCFEFLDFCSIEEKEKLNPRIEELFCLDVFFYFKQLL